MRFRAIVGALMAPALAASVASAQPAPTGSATCDLTDVTFGSPTNSADKSQVTCTEFTGDVQVALTAVARFNGLNLTPPPVVETSAGSGVYMVSNGAGNPAASGLAVWNFNYAITGTNGGIFDLLIDRDPGLGTNYQTFALNFADDPNTGLGYQNSENEGFFNLPGDVFDPNATGTYTFQIRELNLDGRVINTASMNVVVASPEPASMALMATGFVGLAGFVRRRRTTNAA